MPIQKQVELIIQAIRPKIATTVATKPKMVARKATKPMSELLKEVWKAKARVAAQAKKKTKIIKKVSNIASPTMVIHSFEDWLLKRPIKTHAKDKPFGTPKINKEFSRDCRSTKTQVYLGSALK